MTDNDKNIFSKWRDGLARTRKSTFGRISQMLGVAEIDEETWDDLEAMFIQSDIGVETTEEIIASLKDRVQAGGLTTADELRDAIRDELIERLDSPPEITFSEDQEEGDGKQSERAVGQGT